MILIKLKWFLALAIIILTLIFGCGPSQDEKDRIIAENQQVELEEKRLEQVRLDNLNQYFVKAEEEFKKKKIPFAILNLDTALTYAKKKEKNKIISTRASYYFKKKEYNEAVIDYSTLIKFKIKKKYYYERALCYEILKKRQEAVNDLKEAIRLNSSDAEKLHNKINPIRKRIAYYVTRCCDGTTSSAKGRGACSHHGGVCNWNDPVYEEYRKY